MSKIKIKLPIQRILYGFIAMVLVFAYFPKTVSADQITPRKVVIGSSLASASTSYNFTFTLPSATVVQSVKFQACDNSSGACTQAGAASGFSSSAGPATLNGAPTGLGGAGSWTIDTTDATSLRIKNASNSGAPGAATINFNSVRNPSATNSTFFVHITTYSDDTWTTPIDTGVVATSTAGQVTVTVGINELLAFTLASTNVTMTSPSTVSTGTGTSSMTVSTNAATGYSVSYSGATLTSGSDTITAMAAQGASTVNSKQFGINMMANATPAVGVAVSGTGSGTPKTGYDTANQYKFNNAGDVIAGASLATNTNTFTTSYIANMDGSTKAGSYSTILTYTATGNF